MNEMLSQDAYMHFGINRSPFHSEVVSASDIFFSKEHRFIREMMVDTAKYAGFSAIVGEVGSGKTMMRYSVEDELGREGIDIVYPRTRDCFTGTGVIASSALIDAIILDLSIEKPRNRQEDKVRQAVKILSRRQEENCRQCLMIEEAHTLDVSAFKALKQIYEFQNGFKKYLGIILIGQVELLPKLQEERNPVMREVIRRIAIAEIKGLSLGGIEKYIAFKFERAGLSFEKVFDSKAFKAMNAKLLKRKGRKTIRGTYPLSVNLLAVKAMNKAAMLKEKKVTAALVESL
jgi:type II secretory pathway predicted ATPase ExeA